MAPLDARIARSAPVSPASAGGGPRRAGEGWRGVATIVHRWCGLFIAVFLVVAVGDDTWTHGWMRTPSIAFAKVSFSGA
jgi:hypothetical protein